MPHPPLSDRVSRVGEAAQCRSKLSSVSRTTSGRGVGLAAEFDAVLREGMLGIKDRFEAKCRDVSNEMDDVHRQNELEIENLRTARAAQAAPKPPAHPSNVAPRPPRENYAAARAAAKKAKARELAASTSFID